MTNEVCLTYFFGMCVHSEADAREFILAWEIGSAIGLGLVALSFLAVLFGRWRTRNAFVNTIDAILDSKPTKSKHYSEVQTPL